MQDQPWLYVVLITAAPAAFSAVTPVVMGEKIEPHKIRRAYVLAGVFSLGAGLILAAVMQKADPVLAGAAVFAANVAAQEWAISLRSVEEIRPD